MGQKIGVNVSIHPTVVLEDDIEVGDNTVIEAMCHLSSGCKIGNNCKIHRNVFIDSNVCIGNNVKIQNNVSVYTGVVCEDDVFLGPSCVFTNVLNPRSAIPRKDQYRKTLVRRGATIGANATIVCGHTIGEYALIGAGAVVTKDVPPYALVVGNPSRQIGWVSEYGYRLRFDEKGEARCPESGAKYLLKEGEVFKLTMDN